MLDENLLGQDFRYEGLPQPFPTEDDLPETDGKPVDNELLECCDVMREK